MSRRQQRGFGYCFVFGLAGLLVFLGWKGWQIEFLPAEYLGYLVAAFGVAGILGINIWRGGPLDPRNDVEIESPQMPALVTAPPVAGDPAAICANIQPIDDMYAGRILSKKTVVIGNLLCLMPLLALFAGLGLAGGAGYLAFGGDGPDEPPTISAPVGYVLIGIGVLVAIIGGYWGLRNTTKLGNWYLRRLARSEVKSRPDEIVDPDHQEAVFVEIVPRQNWKRLMLETATDVGYLFIDEGRREVLFEGDRERMRIPAKSIADCKVEHTIIGEGTGGGMDYFFTVLQIQTDKGGLELPIAFRGDLGMLGAGIRQSRAEQLTERIRKLIVP